MTPTAAALPVPLLDLDAPYASIKEEVRAALDRVVESQHFILGAGDFPESERAAAASLAIPVYPELDPSQLETVVSAVRFFFRG